MDIEKIFEELRLVVDEPNIVFSYEDKFQTELVRKFCRNLKDGSAPESVVEQFVFELLKMFGIYLSPRGRRERNIVDYFFKDDITGRTVDFEFKPLIKKYSHGFRREALNPKLHTEQVQKYLMAGSSYLLLTNGFDYYFFSQTSLSYSTPRPIRKGTLGELLKDIRSPVEFMNKLMRWDAGHPIFDVANLSKKFLDMLKNYYRRLYDIELEKEHAFKLVNALLMARILEDSGALPRGRIQDRMQNLIQDFGESNPKKILELFFREQIEEFYWHYFDTELFMWNKEEKESLLAKAKEVFQIVVELLGLRPNELFLRGLYSFDFRTIDEDVLGSGYENFLLEERTRKEQGIYYTPSVFSNFLADKVVDYLFDPLLERAKRALRQENYDNLREIASEWMGIKILDPACGSGSFLVKVLRKVFNKYENLRQILKWAQDMEKGRGLFERSEAYNKLEEVIRSIFLDGAHKYMSALCERHIYGIDIDEKALKIAKINLIKELLRLKPELYTISKLRDKEHVFPLLEDNFLNANTLELSEENLHSAIIGNPPYGDLLNAEHKKAYREHYPNSELSEIASLFVEKSIRLLKEGGVLAFVITSAFTYHTGMERLRKHMKAKFEKVEVYNFDRDKAIPFDAMSQSVSLVIALGRGEEKEGEFLVSRFYRVMPPDISKVSLYPVKEFENILPRLPKVGSELTSRILRKLLSKQRKLGDVLSEHPLEGYEELYYRSSGNYWYNAWNKKPYESSEIKEIYVEELYADFFLLLINSSLFYLWMRVFGDGRHLNKDIMNRFPVVEEGDLKPQELETLREKLMEEIFKVFDREHRRFETSEIKHVIDEVDLYLCKLYGLDRCETLYVLNYEKPIRRGRRIPRDRLRELEKTEPCM